MFRLILVPSLLLSPAVTSAQVFSSNDEAKTKIGSCFARYGEAEPENMYNCMRPALIHLSRGDVVRTTALDHMDACYEAYAHTDKGHAAGGRFLGCLENAAATAPEKR